MGVGFSKHIESLQAGEEAARVAVASLANEQLGWCTAFSAGLHTSSGFLNGIRAVIGDAAPVFGGTCIGVMSPSGSGCSGVEAVVVAFPKAAPQPVVFEASDLSKRGGYDTGREIGAKVGATVRGRGTVLLFYDSVNCYSRTGGANSATDLLDGFYSQCPPSPDVKVVGGGLLGDFHANSGYVYCGNSVGTDCVLALVLPAEVEAVSVTMHNNMVRIADVRITSMEGTTIKEIENVPALPFLAEKLHTDADSMCDGRFGLVQAGLSKGGYMTGPGHVREIHTVDTGAGTVHLSEPAFGNGCQVDVLYRSDDILISTMEDVINSTLRAIAPKMSRDMLVLGLYMDDHHRSKVFTGGAEEAEKFANAMNESSVQIPFAGLYSRMQLGPVSKDRSGSLEMCGVLSVFMIKRSAVPKPRPSVGAVASTPQGSGPPRRSLFDHRKSIARPVMVSTPVEYVSVPSSTKFSTLSRSRDSIDELRSIRYQVYSMSPESEDMRARSDTGMSHSQSPIPSTPPKFTSDNMENLLQATLAASPRTPQIDKIAQGFTAEFAKEFEEEQNTLGGLKERMKTMVSREVKTAKIEFIDAELEECQARMNELMGMRNDLLPQSWNTPDRLKTPPVAVTPLHWSSSKGQSISSAAHHSLLSQDGSSGVHSNSNPLPSKHPVSSLGNGERPRGDTFFISNSSIDSNEDDVARWKARCLKVEDQLQELKEARNEAKMWKQRCIEAQQNHSGGKGASGNSANSGSDRDSELEMFKKQLNDLGKQMAGTRRENIKLQFSEHRATTLASLVANAYQLLSDRLSINQVAEKFLEYVQQATFPRDKVAILVYHPADGEFRTWFSMGYQDEAKPTFLRHNDEIPAFEYCNSKTEPKGFLQKLVSFTGEPHLLWAYDENEHTALLIGSPVEDKKFGFYGENHKPFITGALNLFLNLKERKEMDSRKDAFLANCSHELKTPLNAIIGLADSMVEEGDVNSTTKENLKYIRDSGTRLLSLVRDLLDYSTMQLEGTAVEMKPVDMLRLASEALHTAKMGLKDRSLTIKVHGEPSEGPFMVLGEGDRLGQVLSNVIGNATKYTEDGGKVEVYVTRDETDVITTIADTGCGIPKDKIKNIFDEFYQVESHFTRGQGGIGLGLTIVKDLVEIHNGFCSVDSEPGSGTKFSIHLPFTNEQPSQEIAGDALITEGTIKNLKVKPRRTSLTRENAAPSRAPLSVQVDEPTKVSQSTQTDGIGNMSTPGGGIPRSPRVSMTSQADMAKTALTMASKKMTVKKLSDVKKPDMKIEAKKPETKMDLERRPSALSKHVQEMADDPLDGRPPEEPRILLVDDEPLNLRVLTNYLGRENYKLTTCNSAIDALEELKKSRFDMILLDVMMPKMSGLEACRIIRQKFSVAALPIILVTAMNRESDLLAGFIAGANDYITKPFQKQEVTARMRVHLELAENLNRLESKVSVSKEVANGLSLTLRGIAAGGVNAVDPLDMSEDEQTKKWLAFEFSRHNDRVNSAHLEWPAVDSAITEEGKSKLSAWDFDCWKFSHDELLNLIAEMFQSLNLPTHFNFDMETLRKLLLNVKEEYKDNLYHNFRHAFDVTQTTFFMLTSTGASRFLTYNDIFALMLAAIGHDLNHPGKNNSFQINSSNDVAILYNDMSVLENMHASRLFQLLSRDDCNVLCGISEEDRREIRREVIAAILSTDMSDHFNMLSKLRALCDGEDDGHNPTFDKENAEHRRLLMCSVLHSADVSNVAKPWDISIQWVERAIEEFCAQGDEEKKLGLPVSPFMDRDSMVVEQMELNFIDFVVQPLYSTIVELIPGYLPMLEMLNTNRQTWKNRLDNRTVQQTDW